MLWWRLTSKEKKEGDWKWILAEGESFSAKRRKRVDTKIAIRKKTSYLFLKFLRRAKEGLRSIFQQSNWIMSFSCSTSFSSYPSLTGWVSRSSTWHKSSFKIWPLLLPDSPSAYNPPTYLQFSHINTPFYTLSSYRHSFLGPEWLFLLLLLGNS